MPPTYASRHTTSIATLLQLGLRHVPRLLGITDDDVGTSARRVLAKRAVESGTPQFIVFACLIPTLVLLSGLFAGLTLGLMSLDETQLSVLSISGTPQQKIYANKIKPIRKNGHLLLVTLLLANMIVNETLPVISDPVLGGGVPSVVVSTVLIVIFSEVIPQSVCTRYGLAVGATMAPFVKVLLWTLGIFAWPVAKLLEIILGAHHGIIYRRGELKELIQIHSHDAAHGGDLKHDTVTIIGATLDLQEKVVQHAMTPFNEVFMLSIDAVLDFETLRRICVTGHSRVPIYEEIDAPYGMVGAKPVRMMKVKKIVGILLVKQCVLLDPSDAVPVRKIPLNKVATVPMNEPLLGVLDRFQEGRSHMALVTRFSHEEAASVKKVVKKSLTQRIKDRVTGDSSDSSSDEDEPSPKSKKKKGDGSETDGTTLHGRSSTRSISDDVEAAAVSSEKEQTRSRTSFQLGLSGREQSMPADAILAKAGAEEFLQSLDPTVAPLGIITLEDVLEELIGEEIYDEFDAEGAQQLQAYTPAPRAATAAASSSKAGDLKSILKRNGSAPDLTSAPVSASGPSVSVVDPAPPISKSGSSTPSLRPLPALKNLSFFGTRSRSAPPVPRPKVEKKATESPGSRTPEAASTPPVPSLLVPSLLIDSTKLTSPTPLHTRISEEHVDPTTGLVHRSAPATPGIRIDSDPMEAAPSSSTDPSSFVTAQTPVEASEYPAPAVASPVPISALPPSIAHSRAASPAPSLEAFIMGGKRRPSIAAGVGSGSALKERSASIGHKGMRFKSSPLTGERGGVVIAEQVMKDLRGDRQSSNPDRVAADDDRAS